MREAKSKSESLQIDTNQLTATINDLHAIVHRLGMKVIDLNENMESQRLIIKQLKGIIQQSAEREKKVSQVIGMLGNLLSIIKNLSPEIRKEIQKQLKKKKKSEGPGLFDNLDLPF